VVRPRSFRNPGAFDAVRHHRTRGVDALGSVKSHRLVRVRRVPAGPPMRRLLRLADRARARLLETIESAFDATRGGRRAAAVSAALLLGERGGLTSESSRRLQEAGLSHLLAVSGFNVAVLAGLALGLLAAVRIRGRVAAALCLPVLWGYLLLNGDESSVARAVLMATLLLGSRVAWRRSDARNALGAAAIAQLAVAPDRIHDAGFQLTFLATWALIELAVPGGLDPHARGERRRAGQGSTRRSAWRWCAALTRATAAATAGTLPLTVSHFNRVAAGALPANLAGGPLMSAAFVAVIVLQGLAPVSPAAARWTARAIERAVDLVFATSSAVASLPLMSYRRPTPHPAWVAGGMLTLVAAVALSRRAARAASAGGRSLRRSWPEAIAWLGWGTCLLVLCLPLDTRGPPHGLRVTAFDVGQGDALLLETPGGDRVLVDAGGIAGGEFDIGERVVSRALWSLGIARLDLMVITHADLDHAGGAPAIARNFSPAGIWVPAGWHGVRSPVSRALAEALPECAWIREVRAGDAACLGGARLGILHPVRATGDPGDNERSIVADFGAAQGSVLLTGDAGDAAESLLLPSVRRARLLKVGHHGSRSGTGGALLARARPVLAIISCGAGNRFGHPHPQTLRRLEAAGARVLRTDRDGWMEIDLLPHATRLGAGLRGTTGRRAGE
jgi:competence protein ComEC